MGNEWKYHAHFKIPAGNHGGYSLANRAAIPTRHSAGFGWHGWERGLRIGPFKRVHSIRKWHPSPIKSNQVQKLLENNNFGILKRIHKMQSFVSQWYQALWEVAMRTHQVWICGAWAADGTWRSRLFAKTIKAHPNLVPGVFSLQPYWKTRRPWGQG